jgi:25S rRNA (cytosine2278-C5)-methyltransferase
LRRKCATLDALRLHVLSEKGSAAGRGLQPRWVRINNLKTTSDEELGTSFEAFTEYPTLDQLFTNAGATKAYVRDPNIPDLVATNVSMKEITNTRSYNAGKIILQDKASCLPTHLLLNSKPRLRALKDSISYGDVVDACAAPGNKTTHIASILATKDEAHWGKVRSKPVIFACERDAKRSETLEKMLDRAGVGSTTRVLAKQDFLALNPQDIKFSNVTHLLLDPSCSGSGILGREDVPNLVLPQDTRNRRNGTSMASDEKATGGGVKSGFRKRKREKPPKTASEEVHPAKAPISSPLVDKDRLRKLSNLQTRIIEHALAFSKAEVATYSTCSIHTVENEMVALRALSSEIARKRAWRILRRDEQPDGLRIWPHRGDDLDGNHSSGEVVKDLWSAMLKEEREEFREACIRCKPGGVDGTMGFFVVGFVRDPVPAGDLAYETSAVTDVEGDDHTAEGEEWGGFSSDDEPYPTYPL